MLITRSSQRYQLSRFLALSARARNFHPSGKYAAASGATSKVPIEKHEAENNQGDAEVLRSLSGHLWPNKSARLDATEIKLRVMASIGLLFGSKLINIQVPFIFKQLIDTLDSQVNSTGLDTLQQLGELGQVDTQVLCGAPVALALGYGVARSTEAISRGNC